MNNNQHVMPSGQHYSGRNRVPNIQEFMARLDREKQQRDAQIDADLKKNNANGEATEHMNRDERAELKSARWVRDPVTGRDVQIRDAKLDFAKAVDDPQMSIPNENLGKDTTVQKPLDMSTEQYRETMDISAPPDPVQDGATSDVPIRSEKTSVLFYKTPAVSYEPMFESLENRANGLCLGIFLAIIFIGRLFGGNLFGLIPLAFCITSGVFLWCKDLIRQGRDVEWSSEQKRGETATVNLIPESVEWMNTAIGIIWGLINPEMFAAVGDTLEDVMAASVPGVIENIRVADIHQGSNPIRILNMRALPDSHVQDIKEDIRKQNEKTMDPNERAAMEQAGEFYNMEVSVAYHAKPSGQDITSKARNMGMQLVFYLGIRGLFGVPLPIWVELQGLVATARLRLQLTPDPPFLKTMTVTLMGVPKVQAGCTPMVQKGVNILNLPLISNFVNWAISAAASMYVAPKSLTLDVSSLLTGDDLKKDTIAIGVLYLRIHKAVDLSKQDQRGSRGGGSDPYITLAWSKFGKPQFCTRVIQDYLNPYFGESCGLLVTPDIIQADEQLSVELWDSDRSSADDVVGKIELSIQELVRNPGKIYPQVSKLKGLKADSTMPGELHWEVGFFGKTLFRKALRTDEQNPNQPDELKNKPEAADRQNAVPQTAEAEAALHTPPDPLWPSGMLSVVVHQIVGLELANVRGSDGNRKGKEYEPARPEAGEVKEAESKKLPSSYCTILINDDLAYKTRTKVVSSQPIFNAGTEKFVRDWRSAIVTVAVRDSRHRQHDPLIGVIPLKVSDILQTSSEVTRWYPLDGGVGFGRARISLLFKSVELRLPPPELGWEIGTFEFTSNKIQTVGWAPSIKAKLRLRTGGSTASVKRQFSAKEGDNDMVFDVSGNDGSHELRLPVRHRYRSPVFFEFSPAGKRHADAFAAVWLKDIVDSEEQEFDIPLWKSSNSLRLSQNYITEENFKEIPDLDIEEIGRVKFRGRFSPGTDLDHIHFVSDNDSRETIEAWEACYSEGVREKEVKTEVPPLTKELHEKSLTQGRDVLAQASEEERKKWMAKDGTSWAGAFGNDPAESMAGKRRAEEGDEDYDQFEGDDEHLDSDSDEETSGSSRPRTGESGTGMSDLQSTTAAESSFSSGGGDGRASHETNVTDASALSDTSKKSRGPIQAFKEYRRNSRDLHRKQRGLMQWRPMRNAQFAKDEAKYLARKVRNITALDGRKPDVETEV